MENRLKDLIAQGKVIPFVGAGVSKDVKNIKGTQIFPDWKDLLKLLADGLSDDDAQIIKLKLKRANIDYLKIVDEIEEYYPTKTLYNNMLEKIFDVDRDDIEDSSLALAKSIWELKQKLIITTNYDKIMHWASTKPDNTKRWDIESIAEQASSFSDGVSKETVWHLHGHIENKHNIVLTTKSYERFYNASSDEFKTAFETLKIKLATKSFLFVGYSLDDEYFVNELEKITDIFHTQGTEHYVLLKKGKELSKRFDKKIIPIYYEDHGQPLIDLIQSLKPNIPKIYLEKIKELIVKLGGDVDEFLSAYFGQDYQELLIDENTYENFKFKLQNPDSSLSELIKEKQELEKKIEAYTLNKDTQTKIDEALKSLRFEEVREILDNYLKKTEHILEDRIKAHYQKALTYKEQIRYSDAKDEIENINSKKLEDATILNDYADIYELCGEYSEALPLYKKALKIREESLGENHLDTAILYNNLARLYELMGEYKKVEPLHLKALKIREEKLEENHSDMAQSYNNLAILYYGMGEYEKAEPLYLRAQKIKEENLGENHPTTATSYNNLALLYYAMGEYEKAEPLFLKSQKIREESLGENHPFIATSYNNLAGLYSVMGAYEKAEPLYLKSLKIREEVLGENHPDTAILYNNLGTFYYHTQEYQKSYGFIKRALEIFERVLPPNHHYIIECRDGLKVIEKKLN